MFHNLAKLTKIWMKKNMYNRFFFQFGQSTNSMKIFS